MLDIQVLDMAWDKHKNVVGLNIQNIILSSYQSGMGWHPDEGKSLRLNSLIYMMSYLNKHSTNKIPHCQNSSKIPHCRNSSEIPHCQNSSKIPHCQNSSKIPHCRNSSKIPHRQNSSKIPHCQNSSKIPHCQNSSKIPHCQNSSKVLYKNRRKGWNQHPYM